MLKLIQITEDEKLITLHDIIEVVEVSEDQAEDLLTSSLAENPPIGIYASSTKTYIKSEGAEVSAYLENALKLLENLEGE